MNIKVAAFTASEKSSNITCFVQVSFRHIELRQEGTFLNCFVDLLSNARVCIATEFSGKSPDFRPPDSQECVIENYLFLFLIQNI